MERAEGRVVYRVHNHGLIWLFFVGSIPGMLVGLLIALLPVALFRNEQGLVPMAICAIIGGLWLMRGGLNYNCSASDCGASVTSRPSSCPGCGGNFAGNISQRAARKIAAEELEAKAASFDWEECEECRPEVACSRHRATEHFDPS